MKILFFVNAALLSLGLVPLYGQFKAATRWDERWQYQIFGSDCHDHVLLTRFDKVVHGAERHDFFFRVELAYIWLRCQEKIEVDAEGIVVPPPPSGKVVVKRMHREDGISDATTEAVWVFSPWDEVYLGLGSSWMFPTAAKPGLGTGKYRMRPEGGCRFPICSGWDGTAMVKYEFDFAGRKNRPQIRIFYLDASLLFGLPKGWGGSLSLAAQRDGKTKGWFLALGAMAGKTFGGKINGSIEYKRSFVNAFPVFRQQVELGLGYLF